MQPAQACMPVPQQQVGGLVPMQVMIPPNATPGQSIQVNVNGQVMEMVVPPGAQPGSQMTIQVPQAVPTVPVVQAQAVPAVPMGIELPA